MQEYLRASRHTSGIVLALSSDVGDDERFRPAGA